MRYLFIISLLLALSFSGCTHDSAITPTPEESKWVDMLDENLTKFDKFIGVPHYSITTLPGYPKGDGMNGTPIGLNNDPLLVFKTAQQDGALVLHISGEIYGGLTTKAEYENYHFKAKFKWGENKYEPRLTSVRDNGILYHCYGPHGAFWNVWMNSQEMQVQENDMGDYFALGPAMDIKAAYRWQDNEQAWIYDAAEGLTIFESSSSAGLRCRRGSNQEKPHGEWNTLELICVGDRSIHVVNGVVVMRLEHSRVKPTSSSSFVPLTKGKIQIQSEGAEAYYKEMRIMPITEIPEAYR